MPTKTRTILGRVDCCRRWLARAPVNAAMLVGLLLFSATVAHAVPVSVITTFNNAGLGQSVTTEAFYDDASRGGTTSGNVTIRIDRYTLFFSVGGPALVDLSAATGGLGATYINGVFQFIAGGTVPFISPPSPSNFKNLFVEAPNTNRLIVNKKISGKAIFGLDQRFAPIAVVQTTVPEPGTLAVFGIGLLGIGAIARRRRKMAKLPGQ